MLNVDQHNHNVKKQNNPMTAEDFKKNLKKVNGGQDFNQEMLDEIYNSIRFVFIYSWDGKNNSVFCENGYCVTLIFDKIR